MLQRKNYRFVIAFCFSIVLMLCTDKLEGQNQDVFFIPELDKVHFSGYVGEKLNTCIENGILAASPDYYVAPFRSRTETKMWQSEFWGKWITSAIDAYRHTKNEQLLRKIKEGIEGLIATQTDDGYIGNYTPEARLQQWDIWGMKYCLLGLIGYYDISKDKKTLEAAKKLANYVIKATSATHKPYYEFGNYRGMAASSILEPIVQLYNITKQPSYLAFADNIVDSWSEPEASQLIEKGLESIPVGYRFPVPEVWFGSLNGKKAYEMMSCYEGLMELYRIEKKPKYLQAILNTAENIRKDEMYIIGSGSAMECWLHGANTQSVPVKHANETCVTTTWAKFCLQLLRTTGDVKWANEFEKTFYNSMLGAMTPDGHAWSKYTDISGLRYFGERQCGMNTNCCEANGPRGMVVLPKQAFMTYENGLVINFYAPSTANLEVNKNLVDVEQITEYPKTGEITIKINPKKSAEFGVKLRIPEWSKNNTLTINGKDVVNSPNAGTYAEINREWQKGDVITLKFDMKVRQYFLNDDPTKYALFYGPLVLASDSRYQKTPFYSYYTPVIKNGSIPFEIKASSKKDMYVEVKIPFKKEIVGDEDVDESLVLTDFASAGNTWTEESAYLIWFTEPIDPRTGK